MPVVNYFLVAPYIEELRCSNSQSSTLTYPPGLKAKKCAVRRRAATLADNGGEVYVERKAATKSQSCHFCGRQAADLTLLPLGLNIGPLCEGRAKISRCNISSGGRRSSACNIIMVPWGHLISRGRGGINA